MILQVEMAMIQYGMMPEPILSMEVKVLMHVMGNIAIMVTRPLVRLTQIVLPYRDV